MDHFAGLDVSVKETSVCIVDEVGKIAREVRTCRNRSAPRSPRSAASPARPSATATIRCWWRCARGRARPCRG